MSLFSLSGGLQCPGLWERKDPYQVISRAQSAPGSRFSHRGSPRSLGPLPASRSGRGKWSGQRQREGLRGTCPFPAGQT